MEKTSHCSEKARKLIKTLRNRTITKLLGRSKCLEYLALKPSLRQWIAEADFEKLQPNSLIRKIKADPFATSSQLQNATNGPISSRTIRK